MQQEKTVTNVKALIERYRGPSYKIIRVTKYLHMFSIFITILG